ncbi:MAG: zinc ribbon domain-containing protein [Clostridia bacterium]|nr:zinc ribbon domain-containing protein [Clostridia bacterium]
MPTYEYKCSQCGRFEVEQKITEEPLKECPTCGNKVQRLISRNIQILYKASGFYITDNRSKEYSDQVKKESEGKTTTESETRAQAS